jgi:cupin 2 domain-containing protein
MTVDSIFAALPLPAAEEQFLTLVATDNVRIERIVSHGHASPAGFWYEQDWDEWVILLQGSAELEFEHQAPRRLRPGDHVRIKAHARHRVGATDPHEPTVWLAVHHR